MRQRLASSSSNPRKPFFLASYQQQQPSPPRNLLVKDPPEEVCHLKSPLMPDLEHVQLSLVPSSEASDQSVYVFPLVISPKEYTSNFCLRAFARKNRDWIDQMVLKYGAVLFRGFDIDSAQEVEEDVKALEPNLNNQYRGTSPRNAQSGTDYIFSAAEVPSHYPIAQHLEMSFLPAPPKRLFFSALQAPQLKGGETALTDFRKVYRDIPQALREKLAKKKLRYTRTHYRKGASPLFNTDVSSLKGWEELYGTDSKAVVEATAQREQLPVRWEQADKYVSDYVSEPFQLHPQTKEPVWFNHAQVFHWTTFPSELWHSFRRTRDVRFLLRSAYTWILSIVTYMLLRRQTALHVSYGDGTPISVREMSQIRKAIHNNMVFNRWQKGDLLMIDNFSTSHGREPTYDKGRKIVVAWSDPLEKSNDIVYG